MKKIYEFDLQMFADPNVQTTGTAGLSPEMKTYYNTELLDNARPSLVHVQVCEKKKLPANHGKSIEFRKFNKFAPATTPLTEGVTPDGSGVSVSYITATISQYGDYVSLSDQIKTHAIDDVALGVTTEQGACAGETNDIVTRDVMQGGTMVQYASKISDGSTSEVVSRYGLDANCKLTSIEVAKAATALKKMNAPTFDGKYVCIIHPSVAFDLRQDKDWIAAHQYAAVTELFSGEIGELHGVRFVETTEAKIFRGDDLASDRRTLYVNAADGLTAATSIPFDGSTAGVAAHDLKGRYVLIGTTRAKVTDNTASALTVDTAITAADNALIYPGEGGVGGCAVYGCLFVGKGAVGVVDPEGAGMQMIIKPLGSGGTADPLDQRSTIGWKLSHACVILNEERILRVECGSSYSSTDKAN